MPYVRRPRCLLQFWPKPSDGLQVLTSWFNIWSFSRRMRSLRCKYEINVVSLYLFTRLGQICHPRRAESHSKSGLSTTENKCATFEFHCDWQSVLSDIRILQEVSLCDLGLSYAKSRRISLILGLWRCFCGANMDDLLFLGAFDFFRLGLNDLRSRPQECLWVRGLSLLLQ